MLAPKPWNVATLAISLDEFVKVCRELFPLFKSGKPDRLSDM